MPVRYQGGSAAPTADTITTSDGSMIEVVETVILNTNTETGGQDTIPGFQFWSGTGMQYDAITTKDANTIYYVTDR